jgi:hypothetical protein
MTHKHLQRIYEKALQNTLNLENWAIILFRVGRCSEAWARVQLAEATLCMGNLDPGIIAALESRMPWPQN